MESLGKAQLESINVIRLQDGEKIDSEASKL